MDRQTRCPTTVNGQRYQMISGESTSVDITEAALRRIAQLQPALNAFTEVLTVPALADAARADQLRAEGNRSPLLGIPVTVNDDIDIAALPDRFNAPLGNKAAVDGDIVRRLRGAGAVIVARTAAGRLGQQLYPTGADDRFVRNPWAPDHTPGCGGGAAAAVAAGVVAAAIGIDTAGEVRVSAAWNNLIGLKPQRGRISTAPLAESCHGLGGYGVLATTAHDAAAVVAAVMGHTQTDRHTPPTIRLAELHDIITAPLTIAVSDRCPSPFGHVTVDRQIRRQMDNMCCTLEDLGHRVVSGMANYGGSLWWNFAVRAAAGLFESTQRLGGIAAVGDPQTRTRARIGFLLSEATLRKARARETGIRRRMRAVFDHADVLLTPTAATPAPALPVPARTSTVTDLRRAAGACPFTWAWNVLGWPALTVPAGFTDAGLPVGVQLMGPPNSEPMLLALANSVEALTGYAHRRPAP